MAKPRPFRIVPEPAEVAEEPGAKIAEHDVVARSGSIPVFAEGGQAEIDPVGPAGAFPLREEAAGKIGMAVFRKNPRNIFRAEDAEVCAAVVFPAERDQPFERTLPECRFDQLVIQRAAERSKFPSAAAVAVETVSEMAFWS